MNYNKYNQLNYNMSNTENFEKLEKIIKRNDRLESLLKKKTRRNHNEEKCISLII